MRSSKCLVVLCCHLTVVAIFMIFKQYPLGNYEMGLDEPKTVKVSIFLSLYYSYI